VTSVVREYTIEDDESDTLTMVLFTGLPDVSLTNALKYHLTFSNAFWVYEVFVLIKLELSTVFVVPVPLDSISCKDEKMMLLRTVLFTAVLVNCKAVTAIFPIVVASTNDLLVPSNLIP